MTRSGFESGNVNLKISLCGDFTKDGVDLLSLGNALINTHSLFDRTYAYYAGCKRLSKYDRTNYKILTTDIKRGSIIVDTQLIMNYAQGVLPLITTVSPQLLWETTSIAFKYLLTLLLDLKNNRQNQIRIIDSPGAIVYYNQGDGKISVSPSVHNVANALRPSARRLADTFKNGDSGIITVNSPSHPASEPISISNESAPLFQTHRIVTDVALNIQGQVMSYHKESRSGDFYVPANMVLPEGKYPFTISQEYEYDEEFIESLKGYPMRVSAKVEYDLFTLQDSRIVRLYLLPRMDDVA